MASPTQLVDLLANRLSVERDEILWLAQAMRESGAMPKGGPGRPRSGAGRAGSRAASIGTEHALGLLLAILAGLPNMGGHLYSGTAEAVAGRIGRLIAVPFHHVGYSNAAAPGEVLINPEAAETTLGDEALSRLLIGKLPTTEEKLRAITFGRVLAALVGGLRRGLGWTTWYPQKLIAGCDEAGSFGAIEFMYFGRLCDAGASYRARAVFCLPEKFVASLHARKQRIDALENGDFTHLEPMSEERRIDAGILHDIAALLGPVETEMGGGGDDAKDDEAELAGLTEAMHVLPIAARSAEGAELRA